MRIGGSYSSSAINMASLSFSGVTLSTKLSLIGDFLVLMAFKLTNAKAGAVFVDVEVDADIMIDGSDSAPVSDLGSGRGFSMGSSRLFTFIGRTYPLISDVSTYWFGSYYDRSSYYWSNTSATSYSGDSAIAFSWQSLSIPSLGSVSVAAIMRSGSFLPRVLEFSLNFSQVPSRIPVTESLNLPGYFSHPNNFSATTILWMVNGDSSQLHSIPSSIPSSSSFQFSISMRSNSIPYGLVRLEFYIVDSDSCLSPGQFLNITVFQVIAFEYPATANFDILMGEDLVSTTSGQGYRTFMLVGGRASPFLVQGQRINYLGVVLSTNLTVIDGQTVLMSFTAWNVNSDTVLVDIGVDAALSLGLVNSSVSKTADGRGFSASGLYNLTFIGRSHPEVSWVSTFWFGPSSDRSLNNWNSVSVESFYGVSGIAFSWRGMSLRANQSVTVSALLLYGNANVGGIDLNLGETVVPSTIRPTQVLAIRGTVFANSTDVALYYTINEEISKPYLLGSGIPSEFTHFILLGHHSVSMGPCTIRVFSVGDAQILSVVQTFHTSVYEGDLDVLLMADDGSVFDAAIIGLSVAIGFLGLAMIWCFACWCKDRRGDRPAPARQSQLVQPLTD
jgi:hypothetical protein